MGLAEPRQAEKGSTMHEVSLGGVLADYLTGEERECTTYEDLRQALAQYLVEELGYERSQLVPRFSVRFEAAGEEHSREADLAVVTPEGELLLMLVFCPGQVHTYTREVTALARLAAPSPCPLAVVTDMREAELFAVDNGEILARGLPAIPRFAALQKLAANRPHSPLGIERREKESRILHAYTGFLKTCCGATCSLP